MQRIHKELKIVLQKCSIQHSIKEFRSVRGRTCIYKGISRFNPGRLFSFKKSDGLDEAMARGRSGPRSPR